MPALFKRQIGEREHQRRNGREGFGLRVGQQVGGALKTTETSATVTLPMGKELVFHLLDKLKVSLSLTSSFAHRPTILLEMVARAEALPPSFQGNKSLLAPTQRDALKAAEIEGKPLSKKELRKAIEEREMQAQESALALSKEEQAYLQPKEMETMYLILEKMRNLNL